MRRVNRKFCGLFYAAVAGAYRSSVVAASVCIFEPGPATQWPHPSLHFAHHEGVSITEYL